MEFSLEQFLIAYMNLMFFCGEPTHSTAGFGDLLDSEVFGIHKLF